MPAPSSPGLGQRRRLGQQRLALPGPAFPRIDGRAAAQLGWPALSLLLLLLLSLALSLYHHQPSSPIPSASSPPRHHHQHVEILGIDQASTSAVPRCYRNCIVGVSRHPHSSSQIHPTHAQHPPAPSSRRVSHPLPVSSIVHRHPATLDSALFERRQCCLARQRQSFNTGSPTFRSYPLPFLS